jgi:hypothetical protein
MRIVLSLVLSLALAAALFAAEKPGDMLKINGGKQASGMMFTGNSSVDLFSAGSAAVEKNEPFRTAFETPEDQETGDRKNPWLAGGMSLLIPGAGEVYTHSYIKAGVFFGVEVASFLLSRSYNKKGDDQTVFFQQYADAHYNAYRYAKWTYDNISVLNPALNASDYPTIKDGFNRPPFGSVEWWNELNKMERDIGGASSPNGYTHQMPYYGQQQYYELIGKYTMFMSGWDNVDSNYYNNSISSADLPVSDHTLPVNESGLSQAAWYFDQRAAANHYYDLGSTYVTVLIINHLVSAVDAYWSATRYNSRWKAEADVRMLPTPTGMAAVPEVRVKYRF